MLGHFHTCPWLLVSRVPHPAGSQGYLLSKSPECVTVYFTGPSGEEVAERRGMLGLKWELERWGCWKRERGWRREKVQKEWTKGSIMTYQWSVLVIKDNRDDGDEAGGCLSQEKNAGIKTSAQSSRAQAVNPEYTAGHCSLCLHWNDNGISQLIIKVRIVPDAVLKSLDSNVRTTAVLLRKLAKNYTNEGAPCSATRNYIS